VLYASGLVAGGSIMGLAASFLAAPGAEALPERLAFGRQFLPPLVGFVAFSGVVYLVYRAGLKTEAK
jgi:hypothetical protein